MNAIAVSSDGRELVARAPPLVVERGIGELESQMHGHLFAGACWLRPPSRRKIVGKVVVCRSCLPPPYGVLVVGDQRVVVEDPPMVGGSYWIIAVVLDVVVVYVTKEMLNAP